MTVINGVRQAYSRMVDRIPSMSDGELSELLCDLEEHDADGEYSLDAQEAVQGEMALRYMAAHPDHCTIVGA